MNRTDNKWRRRIERALLGELPPNQRTELHTALRGDASLRAEYDRAALALRLLEGVSETTPPVGSFELDLVESWLVADIAAATESTTVQTVRRWLSLRNWVSIAGAATAAALMVVLAPSPGPDPVGDGMVARGSAGMTALALDALCGDESVVSAVGGDGLTSVADGCRADDTLAFSYYLDAMQGGHLSLFGIDADGDTMYYAPTPGDESSIAVKPAAWRAVGVGVNLKVNHAAGTVRVYGLVSPRVPTVEQVDAFASALAEQPAAVDARPSMTQGWLDRLGRDRQAAAAVRAVCPTPAACHAAEFSFVIAADAPTQSVPAGTAPGTEEPR